MFSEKNLNLPNLLAAFSFLKIVVDVFTENKRRQIFLCYESLSGRDFTKENSWF